MDVFRAVHLMIHSINSPNMILTTFTLPGTIVSVTDIRIDEFILSIVYVLN